MLITWIYQFIVLLLCGVLVWEIVEQKKIADQLIAVVVLVPLLLRLLMIK
jgi:hypothetical protein